MDVALDLASARDASVLFLHFTPLAVDLYERVPGEAPSQEEIERADPVLRAAAGEARAHGVPFELQVVDEHGAGDIAAVIAGIAEGAGADLIVVGSRGRGAVAGAVLGSVSHGLLGMSRLPILVTHGTDQRSE